MDAIVTSAVANSSMTFHNVIASLSTFIQFFLQAQDTQDFDLHYH